MPKIESHYSPSKVFRNGFLSTVYSGIIRYLKIVQKRERITLEDGDFLDLDWSYALEPSKKLVIILHGMEGHGQRPYVSGVARHLNTQKIDAICVNFRGCSGENNLKLFSFHSGQTEDLKAVIDHVISNHNYDSIFLNG
ncbi:MAG: alpha/beta hydrolase, partial [Bacteroidota bacterium]|nr:alpha/beta hydrolase [Bacteroidota bacterium]